MLHRLLHHWDHHVTSGMGLGFLAGATDLAAKGLGILALIVGITCSIRREVRESRSAREREEAGRARAQA